MLLTLASVVILESESLETHDHILLSQIRDSPNLEDQVPRIYIPREHGGPVISPGTGFPSRRLLRLAGRRWGYSTPPPHGINTVSLCNLLFEITVSTMRHVLCNRTRLLACTAGAVTRGEPKGSLGVEVGG
jgi:hypothetical protein